MPRLAPLVVVLALLVPGCGGDGRGEAVDGATSWLEAVRDGDAERACELMAPSAVSGGRAKQRLDEDASCPDAVRAYAKAFGARDIDAVLKAGLEVEGPVKKDQVGVFPKSGDRELEVILMRRSGDEWKVASMSLGLAS